jgi:hypothetical protein
MHAPAPTTHNTLPQLRTPRGVELADTNQEVDRVRDKDIKNRWCNLFNHTMISSNG